MKELIEKVWDGWKVVRKMGSGGFSTVYEIQRSVFGKAESAALKVISIPKNPDEIEEYCNEGYTEESIKQHYSQYMEELVKEYSIMLDMKGYTNIVYCDDLRYVKHSDGIGWYIFIKMELLSPLFNVWASGYSERDVVRLGMDVCNALIICKKKNVVHRDIKPQNIFVSGNGDYKLGDFGVAKVSEKSQSGTKIGTLDYMSPEVFSGRPYGDSADLYSLGIMLYFFLNEKCPPFVLPSDKILSLGAKNEAAMKRLSGETLPLPRHGGDELKQLVLKACAFEPSERYASAEEMLEALRALGNPATENILKSVDTNFDDSVTVGRFDLMPEPEMDFEENVSPVEDVPPSSSQDVPKGAKSPDTQLIGEETEKTEEPDVSEEKPDAKKKKSKRSKIIKIALVALGVILFVRILVYLVLTMSECDHFSYTLLDDGTYSVKGTVDCMHRKIEIPSEYEGRPVTAIAENGFSEHEYLKEVVVPDSIAIIGGKAFAGSENMEEIEFPSSVTSIGDFAFKNCESLVKINIPEKVSHIGENAFLNCVSLSEITIPAKVTEISAYMFNTCTSLKSITIPNGVKLIGDNAFIGCTSLEIIELPKSVESIGELAFYGCTSLAEITLPEKLNEIAPGTFYNCSSLKRIDMCDSLEKIGANAFYGCSDLAEVAIPAKVSEIGNNAFELCGALSSVTIPRSVSSMGARVFHACNRLETIYCEASWMPIYGWDLEWIGNSNSNVRWGS